ncbi:MAG: hypothetical protein ACJAUP_003002 [Cellvibrionaceae bacterium]|jgi:hypothetical protein
MQHKKSDLQQIREELQILNKHRFVRIHNSMPKMLWLFFLKGIFFGLGSVLGASIVVSIVVTLLAQVEFIPIIGEWAKDIMLEIQQHQQAP